MVDGQQPSDEPAAEVPAAEQPAPDEAARSAARAAAVTEAAAAWPAVAYWAVGPQPIVAPAPAWSRAYELPTARRVVSAGLQLAVSSTAAVRRASIYIGLLSLGAFGPAVLLLLVGIGRLITDPATSDTIANDPSLILFDQPEILGSFVVVWFLFVVGFVLLIAIGIDSQAIAIALLAGNASGQPLRLWEAVIRARQVFWRLLGAGLLVGLVEGVISLLLTLPLLRPYDSNQGLSFFAQMIGILAVTPFAFASTGIVLGDVGPIETLKRSVRLFRARKRVALVVTLFTLVTAAIQTFAILGGLDLAVRVAQLMHLGLDQGPVAAILLVAVVLAFIVAYGSLAFTIAAIVAAPQVAGFLGLTFYAGGLDRARVGGDAKPPGFRWVTVPMAVAMALLVVVGALGLPGMINLQPKAPSAILGFVRAAAQGQSEPFTVFGRANEVDDPAADVIGAEPAQGDLVHAEAAYLPEVPDWLLDDVFACGTANVACSLPRGDEGAFDGGALLFVHRFAGEVQPGVPRRISVLIAAPLADAAPRTAGDPYSDASDVYVTRIGPTPSLVLQRFDAGRFSQVPTAARSTWTGTDVFTLIPAGETGEPYGWDAEMLLDLAPTGSERADTLRRDFTVELLSWDTEAWIYILDMRNPGSFPPFGP
jgi:hypothetical protein